MPNAPPALPFRKQVFVQQRLLCVLVLLRLARVLLRDGAAILLSSVDFCDDSVAPEAPLLAIVGR